ncbi:glycosyltransferase family 4 protein [Bifidobacterium sp. UBA744]|uniref:glycosyltransferase family 4 protein n=1 Tax=Bifidobacterium sp. UBA744 TaxID=1946112 RepID=UPI0025C21B23|nr:glycosyltransferase family 4 protein [Bifidobacterium sp. UBA744]
MSYEEATSDPLHGRKLRIGIISPYSFETPGGVQFHIRDFAGELIERGHSVEILAPGRRTHDMPLWVHTTGTSFSIPYNGSRACLSYFGFAGLKTRMWVRQGHFDILHLHEPEAPSLSHKPFIAGFTPCPYVATFHSAFDRYPKALRFFERYLKLYLGNLREAICVSEAALDTARHYLPDDVPTHVIPNGIRYRFFADAPRNPDWLGTPEAPTVGFLGRMGEERKGFAVFAEAASHLVELFPRARFLCAGDGQAEGRAVLERYGDRVAGRFEFLGRLSDADKARFYRSLSVYVAPQIGGESFGIVLAEAMAAGCPVVASDLKAFSDVSERGRDALLFRLGDGVDCSRAVARLLGDSHMRSMVAARGGERARCYDWKTVADRVLGIYARVLSTSVTTI